MSTTPSSPDQQSKRQEEGKLFSRRYREVTVSSLVFGLVVGAIMNAAIAYAGLKIGFTIVGSAIAAVLGFGVLRGLLRRGTILETNIGQTVASAVNTPNAGVIFTIPVLFLLAGDLGWESGTIPARHFWLLTLACVAGAVLGCAFIIPLRKQMLDIDRLRFPSATAVAAILKSPGAGPKKSLVLLFGAILSMLLYLPAGLPSISVLSPVEKLDSHAAQGSISDDQVERTRELDGWISAQQAPESIVRRGRALHRGEPVADPGPALHSDEAALAAYQATVGERPWGSLRSREYGWAVRPLRGYGDLGWRLSAPDPVRPGVPGDQERHDAEWARVDREGDARPDLVLTHEMFDLGRLVGLPDQAQLVFAIAPFALGAGYLTGKAGLLVLAAGILAYFILNTFAFGLGWMPSTVSAAQAPGYAFEAFNRPLGIGLLLGGALMGIVLSLPAIKQALKSIAMAGKSRRRNRPGHPGGGGDAAGLPGAGDAAAAPGGVTAEGVGEGASAVPADELGLKVLSVAAVAAFILLFLAATLISRGSTVEPGGLLAALHPVIRNLIIALVGVVWIWFAGIIISQCTGMTDWSPISGMALLTVVLVMLLAGPMEILGAVMLGAALCVAITCAADMMADLKTGYLVGAQPRRQQVVELIFTGIGPVITMGVLLVIVNSNLQKFGVPIGVGTDTIAPQAQALQAVITGVQGGEMPYMLYGLGTVLGVLLGLGSFPGLGVLVGLSMYLPIVYILTYGLGCIANMGVSRVAGKGWAEEWGVPFCAGLIVGEATLALGINTIVLLQG